MARKKYNMRKGVFDKLDKEDKGNYIKSLAGPSLKKSKQIKNKQNATGGIGMSPQYKKHKKRQQVKQKGAL